MKKDLENKADIQVLVDRFYEKVEADALLAPIFNKVAEVDWDAHLPKMYEFWYSILFGGGNYKGDPMTVHTDLAGRTEMGEKQFSRWLTLFEEAVREHFEGRMADEAVQRAHSIAGIMKVKVARKGEA